MEFEQMIRLIETVSASELSSFSYEEKDTKLTIKKEKKEVIVSATPQLCNAGEGVQVVTGTVPQSIEKTSEQKPQVTGNEMKSPLVGTFYNAPSPDAEPFVKVGDKVKKGQTLGLIEAMKLMNEIECEYDGVVSEILVDNMDMVEYGQTLFIIS